MTPPPISRKPLVTSNVPNRNTTVGRIDTKTGAVKMFRVNGPGGLAANTHGITRDPNGIIWFDVNAGRRGLARLDPKAEKIDVHIPPTGMSPTGGAHARGRFGRLRPTGPCVSIPQRKNSPSSSP